MINMKNEAQPEVLVCGRIKYVAFFKFFVQLNVRQLQIPEVHYITLNE